MLPFANGAAGWGPKGEIREDEDQEQVEDQHSRGQELATSHFD